MNKNVKIAAKLSFFCFLALSLSGCSETLTAQSALQKYKSMGPSGFFYLETRFQAVEEITSGNDRTYKIIQVDRGEDTCYLYQREESTVNGNPSTSEVLIYQTSETRGRMWTNLNGGIEESSVDFEAVWASVKEGADSITDVGGADYSYLFEDKEGYESSYSTGTLGYGVNVTQKYTESGVAYELSASFTRQSALTNLYTKVTSASGEVATESIVISYNSSFHRKSSL